MFPFPPSPPMPIDVSTPNISAPFLNVIPGILPAAVEDPGDDDGHLYKKLHQRLNHLNQWVTDTPPPVSEIKNTKYAFVICPTWSSWLGSQDTNVG